MLDHKHSPSVVAVLCRRESSFFNSFFLPKSPVSPKKHVSGFYFVSSICDPDFLETELKPSILFFF